MNENLKREQHQLFDDSPLLKGGDVARLLNISRSNAYNLMRQGFIPTVHIGNCLRVRKIDLEHFILQNKRKNEAKYE